MRLSRSAIGVEPFHAWLERVGRDGVKELVGPRAEIVWPTDKPVSAAAKKKTSKDDALATN